MATPLRRTNAAAIAMLALAVAGCVAAATGCTGKGSQNPNAQSIERQSDAEYQLAVDLLTKDNPRAALDHAVKAINLNEENDKAQYFVAAIYAKFCSTNRGLRSPECKLGEIEKYARAAIKANGEFRDAKNLLGSTLTLEKRCKEAIAILEPLTKDPAYIHPHFAWGNLCDAQLCDGQLDAAVASCKNSVAAEPRFCVGYHRLGLTFEKKNDFASAEPSFTSAVSADPGCEELQDGWWGRCRVRKRLNNPEWKKDCEKCRDISAETDTGKLCVQMLGPVPSPAAPVTSASPGTPGTPAAPATPATPAPAPTPVASTPPTK